MEAVIIFSILLGVLFAAFAKHLIKEEAVPDIFYAFILVVLSFIVGIVAADSSEVSASDYLKSPDSFQVDTFMVNGVVDHYEVSSK